MDENRAKELIMTKQNGGRISCHAAMEVAKEAGLTTRKVGELLNEMQIKICACQLGCFK
jgi:hypothetical protein